MLAVIFSVIGAFYYLRVVKAMYFDEPATAPASTPVIVATTDMRVALSINGALVLVLGILPQYLLKLCADAVTRALGGYACPVPAADKTSHEPRPRRSPRRAHARKPPPVRRRVPAPVRRSP